jgi:uncharacterized membrane protein
MKNHKGLAAAFLLLAFAGFIDATFLAAGHSLGSPVPCSIIEGCEKVLTSHYASIGPVPTALAGSAYYLIIFLLALISITRGENGYLLAASRLTVLGLAASIGFVFLQLFVIKAICLYCMLSASASAVLFILGVVVIRKNKGREADEITMND